MTPSRTRRRRRRRAYRSAGVGAAAARWRPQDSNPSHPRRPRGLVAARAARVRPRGRSAGGARLFADAGVAEKGGGKEKKREKMRRPRSASTSSVPPAVGFFEVTTSAGVVRMGATPRGGRVRGGRRHPEMTPSTPWIFKPRLPREKSRRNPVSEGGGGFGGRFLGGGLSKLRCFAKVLGAT